MMHTSKSTVQLLTTSNLMMCAQMLELTSERGRIATWGASSAVGVVGNSLLWSPTRHPIGLSLWH